MILSDSEIRAALLHRQLIIDPRPVEEHITTSSVDLTLGSKEFKRWKAPPSPAISIIVDPSQKGSLADLAAQFLEDIPLESDGSVLIRPQEFLLALTHERVELPEESRLAARVEGRSSLARLGLGVHVTAPTIHSGFNGQITLEITNHGVFPIKLRPGMRICQLILEMLFGTPASAMTGSFQDQSSVTGRATP
jgi:dCTP deaminase